MSVLKKSDLPYTVGMIVLDILVPIFLMIGSKYGSAANASLLGNFEIVATTVITSSEEKRERYGTKRCYGNPDEC